MSQITDELIARLAIMAGGDSYWKRLDASTLAEELRRIISDLESRALVWHKTEEELPEGGYISVLVRLAETYSDEYCVLDYAGGYWQESWSDRVVRSEDVSCWAYLPEG